MHWSALLIVPAVFVAWFIAIRRYRPILICHWHEPVLKYPVVIIESDDWGPGTDKQVIRLQEISTMLSRYQDTTGRHPVITIGVVLGVPDVAAIHQGGSAHYQRVTLADSRYSGLLAVLQDSVCQDVLALQLHGMEHFWPSAFMRLAQQDSEVRRWLEQGDEAETETLPPSVQSRWVDGSTLPSSPLELSAIQAAAREEMTAFGEIFGNLPTVAVPPTFIWTAEVERAWAADGVQFVVTPGRRYTARNAQGQPADVDRQIFNGEIGDGGVRYLVRDIYFEPTLDHQAEQALTEIKQRYRLGRPALLETHRFNFLGDELAHRHSLQELERLLDSVLREWPNVRFMSTKELGEAYQRGDSELFERRWLTRIHVWLRRLITLGWLRKLTWIMVI